jgi:hypothetical protein
MNSYAFCLNDDLHCNNLIEDTYGLMKDFHTCPSGYSAASGSPSDVIKEFRDMFLENYLERHKIGRRSKDIKSNNLSVSCPDSRTRPKMFIKRQVKHPVNQERHTLANDSYLKFCSENWFETEQNKKIYSDNHKPSPNNESYINCTCYGPISQMSNNMKRHYSSMNDLYDTKSKTILNSIDSDSSIKSKLLCSDDDFTFKPDNHTQTATLQHSVETESNPSLFEFDIDIENLFDGYMKAFERS